MARFSEDVIRMDEEGAVRLWHRRTGRSLSLPSAVIQQLEGWDSTDEAPPGLRAILLRLDALHLLEESSFTLERLIPAPSRLGLLLPAVPALWLPIPAIRTPGGFAYAERPLSAAEIALWRAFNGHRTLAEAAAKAGRSLSAALAFLATLTAPEVQAVQLRDAPVRARDLSLERLIAPPRPAAYRPEHLHGVSGETTLGHYHSAEITHAEGHFDDRETTVAHAFALPHPGFGGQPYGERLFGAMARAGMLPAGGGVVLEIGGGDGELGAAWRAAAAGRLPREHTRLDLSPALLEAQAARQPGTRGVLGSATALPFEDHSLDLVICNEVIADLSAVPFSLGQVSSGAPQKAVAERLDRYGIAPLPGRALYNLGAWQLLEELARTLRPGGSAFLSEFGELDEAPQETEQLDHPEVSIHFGHLLAVARGLGLEARCVPLAEFLSVDLGKPWLSRWSYEALRARFRAEGRSLAARAWTPETLALPWPVEGLQYVSLADPGPGPLITRFQALVLRAA